VPQILILGGAVPDCYAGNGARAGSVPQRADATEAMVWSPPSYSRISVATTEVPTFRIFGKVDEQLSRAKLISGGEILPRRRPVGGRPHPGTVFRRPSSRGHPVSRRAFLREKCLRGDPVLVSMGDRGDQQLVRARDHLKRVA
jgi:hypothetical protein